MTPGAPGGNTRKQDALDAIPPLPAVALRVMQVAQDPKSSASDLALVISSDPGLSGRILKVVNSAAYRRDREVTSVQEALVVLGFIQARNIAISSAITGAYAPDSLNALFRISAFWRHSIAVAFKASEVVGPGRKLDVPSAFTAGVLHNMGRLAMFYADPAGVDQSVALALSEDMPLEDAERQLLDYDHAELGGTLARRWKLPDDIAEAVAAHHGAEPGTQSLASAVAQADRYCVALNVLPGYVNPAATNSQGARPPEFVRLMKQVDALLEMVSAANGHAPGMAVA